MNRDLFLAELQSEVTEYNKILSTDNGDWIISGNTKNIGAVSDVDDLLNGNGLFAKLGESLFDNYWMNYLTKDMAKDISIRAPIYKHRLLFRV